MPPSPRQGCSATPSRALPSSSRWYSSRPRRTSTPAPAWCTIHRCPRGQASVCPSPWAPSCVLQSCSAPGRIDTLAGASSLSQESGGPASQPGPKSSWKSTKRPWYGQPGDVGICSFSGDGENSATPSPGGGPGGESSISVPPLVQGPAVPTFSRKSNFLFLRVLRSMGRQCVTPCFLTLAHDPFCQYPREYGSGTTFLPTHLWPVPFGTQGVRWGYLRTHRLLYHPPLLPFAAPPQVCRLCRWSRLHSIWRCGSRCPACLAGSRAQFDTATWFSSPGLSCFDPSATQTVPTVCARRSGMAVQDPPLRALPVSPCAHEGRRRRPYPVTGGGRQDPQLPRRLAYPSPIQRAAGRSQGLGAPAPQPVGASGQLGKEQALPRAENLFSQCEVRLGQYDGTPHRGTCPSSAELPDFLQRQECGTTETVSEAPGVYGRSDCFIWDHFSTGYTPGFWGGHGAAVHCEWVSPSSVAAPSAPGRTLPFYGPGTHWHTAGLEPYASMRFPQWAYSHRHCASSGRTRSRSCWSRPIGPPGPGFPNSFPSRQHLPGAFLWGRNSSLRGSAPYGTRVQIYGTFMCGSWTGHGRLEWSTTGSGKDHHSG